MITPTSRPATMISRSYNVNPESNDRPADRITCTQSRQKNNTMTEVFRNHDSATIGHLQSLLESNGIKTYLQNEFAALTPIIFSETGSALCILDDADVERGVTIIREYLEASNASSSKELTCANCGELSPGTFAVCWKCGEPLETKP